VQQTLLEKSAHFYQTARRHIWQDSNLHKYLEVKLYLFQGRLLIKLWVSSSSG